MTDLFIPLPASPPITEIHLWIGHYASGGEGLISADFERPEGVRHMPLMNSVRARAQEMEPLARRVQSMSRHSVARITSIELRTFRVVSP